MGTEIFEANRRLTCFPSAYCRRLIHTMDQAASGSQPHERDHDAVRQSREKYMLYMHVPFCERLCPYCSFNRYPFREEVARPYFANMRKEMLMLKDLGYDFESIYVGGGTPHRHDRRAVRDARHGSRQLQHQGGRLRDQPEPSDAAVVGQAAGSCAAFERGRAKLRRRPAQADGPLREVRQRRRPSWSASPRRSRTSTR